MHCFRRIKDRRFLPSFAPVGLCGAPACPRFDAESLLQMVSIYWNKDNFRCVDYYGRRTPQVQFEDSIP